MATKEKVKKMSEEDEQKMAMWIRESKGRSSLLPDEKMAERYPVAYSMLCDEQQEQSAKEQPKEDETIDITDSSVVTPSVTVTEPMSVEPTQEEPPVHRVSSKQRRLSLEEYRSVYLPVPKIENRMPVFISARLRDELERRLNLQGFTAKAWNDFCKDGFNNQKECGEGATSESL